MPIDPLYPPERLAFMLEDAEVQVVLTQRRFLSGPAGGKARLLCLDGDLAGAADAALETAVPVTPDNLAYVIYTSGSTGRPKGVMVSHRGVVNYLSWCIGAYALDEGGSAPVHSPVGFDLAVTALFGPLLSGGRVVLIPEERGIEGMSAELETNGDFSLIKLTPSFLEVLNQLLGREQMGGRARALVLGRRGAARRLADALRAGSGRRLFNALRPDRDHGRRRPRYRLGGRRRARVPIGRPIAEHPASTCSTARLRPAPVGRRRASCYIGGAGWRAAISDRPGLTAERFVPDPVRRPSPERGSTAPATWRAAGRTASSSSSAGSTSRSRCAASASSWGRSRRPSRHARGPRGGRAGRREDAPGRAPPGGLRGAPSRPPAAAAELRAFLQERLPEYMLPAAFVALRPCRSPPTARSTAGRCPPRPDGPSSGPLRRAPHPR